jgi:cell division protein FtsW
MECSIYRMRQRDVLTVCVLALLCLGVVMVQSASTSLTGRVVKAAEPDPAGPRLAGPERVAALTAVTTSDGIELYWETPPGASAFAYRIYRSDAAGGEYDLLETVSRPGTRYVDAAAPVGQALHYRVTSIDDAEVEGTPAVLTAVRPAAWHWTQLGTKHLIYVAAAFATYLLVGHLDYTKLARPVASPWASPILWAAGVALLACVAVLIPGIGTTVNGARRWIKLGPIQVQPSELAKWGLVLFLAWWMTLPGAQPRKLFRGFLPAVLPVGVFCLLVVIQDFGTAALIGLCAVLMLTAARVKWWHLAMVVLPAAAIAVWFVTHKEYRLRRIMAFRDPYASPQGEGYHMIQSLLSFSTGGVFGRGLGNGIQKLGYLPEDTTDFIFAVICEELGLFGALLTIALYLGVMYVAWQVVKQKRDDFGRLLAFGLTSMLGLQAAINIAVATVSVPTKGLSLPLVSAGGSGLIITCAAMGLLYSVTRFEAKRQINVAPETASEDSDTIRGLSSAPVATLPPLRHARGVAQGATATAA